MLNQNVFRAYDIRGVYPSELNGESAILIALAFATYLKRNFSLTNPKVVVGRDNRIHSPQLHKSFIEALVESGCIVTDIGVSPTPYLYFANTFGEFDGGCNITASHNPKEYNGFKLITKNGHALFGDEIQKIYHMAEAEDFSKADGGTLLEADFYNDYLAKLKTVVSFPKSLKIVVDSGNGVSGELYIKVLKDLGHDVVELYTELDGNFPNHQPDPVVEANYDTLKAVVVSEEADLGLAFDGDGDRAGVVDDKGNYISADKIQMLLAKDVLIRYPGASIVATVSSSQTLFDSIKSWGGNPIMTRVGHSFVESAMHDHNAILGGEQSGHFFLPEGYYSYDDALVAGLRVMSIVSHSDVSSFALFDEFPKVFAEPEMRIPCPDNRKFAVIKSIVNHFKNKYPSHTEDGIRLDFGNGGWAGIRASNTSPKISVIMEALTQTHLDKIKEEILGHLKHYPEINLKQ